MVGPTSPWSSHPARRCAGAFPPAVETFLSTPASFGSQAADLVCLSTFYLSAYLPTSLPTYFTKTPRGKMKENYNRKKPKKKDF